MKLLLRALPWVLAATPCRALSSEGSGQGSLVAADAEHSEGQSTASLSPLQQVLTLLGSLEGKVTAAGEKEEAAYTKFAEWCNNGARDKQYEIKTAKATIEDLTATITKANSDIAGARTKIESLASEISSSDADLKAATQLRQKEEKEFTAAEAELADVVQTLDRAVNVVQRKMRGSALMQVKIDNQDVDTLVKTLGTLIDAASMSIHDKQRLIALAQNRANTDDGEDALGAPAPEAYKAHSEGILDVLEDMREKAETQLAELRKQEVNERHNYEMTKQSVEDQIAADQKDLAEAKTDASSAGEAKAAAEGDLAVTQKDLKDGEEALELMSTSCTTAAADHEASMKARAEELKALADAKAVLSESTTGAAGQTYSSFLQEDSTQDRLAGGSKLRTRADLANFEVVNLIRRLAKTEKSTELAQLASRVSAAMQFGTAGGADPFEKVKELIKGMLARLEEEAGSEATHKAYCDKEMAGTKEKIEDLTSSLDSVRAKIDKKKATSVTLKNEVQELQAELAKLAKSQADLDEVRREENKAYNGKKADLELGLQGVRRALQILRQYYAQEAASPADAAAFVQRGKAGQGQPAMPEFHTKAAGASTGIVGLLEVVEADFGKSLAQAEMEEDTAATEYEKISMKNRITKTTKESDTTYKTKESANLDKEVAELSSDSDSTQTELDAVLEYSKSIRSQCVAKPETYEERKARREAEIAGLKEALSILGREAAFLQSPRKILRALRGIGGGAATTAL